MENVRLVDSEEDREMAKRDPWAKVDDEKRKRESTMPGGFE